MAVTLEAFGPDKLSVDDRMELLHLLAGSVAPPPSPDLVALLRERAADPGRTPGDEVSHGELMAELVARHGE